MDLSPSILGLFVGSAVGLLDFIVLTFMGRQLREKAHHSEGDPAEHRNVIGLIKASALGSLVLFPIIGYFAGPYVFGGLPGNVGG